MTIKINPASASWKVKPSAGATHKAYPCWEPSSNYAEITIDHTKLTGDVTDLVIPLTARDLPAGFWGAVDAAGLSIVVTDAHSNRILRRQVPHIDTVGETLEVYARVPSISASVDTDLLLSVAPYTLAQDMLTWPSSWVFASDMSDDDAGTGIRDWSRYGNHGTKGAGVQAPSEAAGLIGRAQDFDRTLNQYISLGNGGIGDDLDLRDSFSIVVLVKGSTTDGSIVQKLTGYSAAGIQYMLRQNGTNAFYAIASDGTTLCAANCGGAVSDQWYALATLFGGSNVFGWRDATKYTSATTIAAAQYRNAPVFIGGGAHAYNNLICEVWFSSEVLSDDEWTAIDAALRGTATFYGVTSHF